MKTTKYRICWKSLEHEGVGGRGEYINDFETAREWVEKLNKQYPEIYHWYEFEKLQKENTNENLH